MAQLNGVTQILDSASGDTGSTYEFTATRPDTVTKAVVQCEIGSGDTVVFEGRLSSDASFVTIATFTADTLVEVVLPTQFRARRTVDGGSADSEVWVRANGR